jgi:membrane protein implicated in regulation of membrane protease activity
MNGKTWLDALTDGQVLRDWFSLIVSFALGILYVTFFAGGYAISLGLSVVLVGIPLLLFMLASTRVAAAMDRRVMAAILETDDDELDTQQAPRGSNLGERLGFYLGDSLTWRSLVYVLLKFPIGLFAFCFALCILPILAIEVLLLGPLTVDMHLLSVRLLHGVVTGMHRLEGVLLPTRKSKRARRPNRLAPEEEAEPLYYLDDDGEVAQYKHS